MKLNEIKLYNLNKEEVLFMTKILVISSSLRTPSSSNKLVQEAIKGIKENKNNKVDFVDLKDFKINFCHGCLACQSTGKCVQKDSMEELLLKMQDSEVILFASPIYFYSISGLLKTFLDRTNPIYGSPNNKFKRIYTLFTCADTEDNASEKPILTLQGWIDCFDGVEHIDSYLATGVNSVLDLNDELLQEAYEYGKRIK